jgi:RNA polymerase sigma factor (sigma-70 family)
VTLLLSSALLATQSDARLASLAAAGHDRAFEAIVERYRRPLGRYLRRVLSAPLAEDVLQATFVNAWRSLQRGTDVRDLRPWLYRIAHNQAVNALARAEPRVAADAAVAELVATSPSPEAEAEQRDTLQRTLTAIAGLPDRQRAAIVAVAVEDRPHPDVARELGLTEGALRQLIHRARTTLRAAATAVVPVPLVTAAVGGAGDTPLARVAEVAAGTGGAGLGVKTGAALLAAGAMVVGAPAVHEQHAHPGLPRTAIAHAGPVPAPARTRAVAAVRTARAPRAVSAHRRAARPTIHRTAAPAAVVPRHRQAGSYGGDGRRDGAPVTGGDDDRGHGSGSSGPSSSAGSGSGDGGDGRRTEAVDAGGDRSGRSGPGEDTTAASTTSGGSGSGSGSGSGDSGSGSGNGGGPAQATVAPVETTTTDSSGHGSDDVPALP